MTTASGPWGPPRQPPTPPAPVSKRTAALLAFLLGWVGVHNFYLGQRGRGIGHILLFVLGILSLVAVMFYAVFAIFWYSDLYLGHTMDAAAELFLTVLTYLAFGLIVVDVVWAVIEGVVILVRR